VKDNTLSAVISACVKRLLS